MRSDFVMEASTEAHDFLLEIAQEMQALFGISHAEAVARINAQWVGQKFLEPFPIITHEMPEYWAMVIYYVDVPSWESDVDRTHWEVREPPSRESDLWPAGER